MNKNIVLSGLDGSNPLAFLAALGTLRSLTRALPEGAIKLGWSQHQGAWKAVLWETDLTEDVIVNALFKQCGLARNHPTLSLADDLTIPAKKFRAHLNELVALNTNDAASFATAFGCDAIIDDKGNIADTSLRTMSGAGHQHFLKTMRDVLDHITGEHIRKTLFQTWRYEDPLQGLSLRFDPIDEKRYALRWSDPSGDPTRNKSGNMLGANALAVLGIPLLTVAPARGELRTAGFRGSRSSDCRWTWPIWRNGLNLDVVSSLLFIAELQEEKPSREYLSRTGVVEVYRSRRITTGKFRNFTPASPA